MAIQIETRDQRFECVQITQTHDGAYRLRGHDGREVVVLGHAIKSIVNLGCEGDRNLKSAGTISGTSTPAAAYGSPGPWQPCPTCGR